MLLIQCVTAYVVLRELMEKEYDYKTAYAIVTLARKLKPHVEFYSAEEVKLIERFAVKDEKNKVILEGNSWKLKDPADAEEYRASILALGAVEVDEFNEPIKVPAMPNIKPAHIDALLGFIEFGGE